MKRRTLVPERHDGGAMAAFVLLLLLTFRTAHSQETIPGQDTEPPLLPVTPVPEEVREQFKLAPFYRKYASADGFPVVASGKVHDAALREAVYLIELMLQGRDDIRQALIESRTRFSIMGYNEFTTEIPEHSDLTPRAYWDRRARGLGATPKRPSVSCGEENLLAYPGDPYKKENILIHEFAHAIHDMALKRLDPEFDPKLKAIYDQAMSEGLWKGKYASNNRSEYWAEGVQSFFGTNRPPDHDHNHVDTREELREYDPRLHALIQETFPKNDWVYIHPSQRRDARHLRELQEVDLPRFVWPKRLASEAAKLEKLKREKRAAAESSQQKQQP